MWTEETTIEHFGKYETKFNWEDPERWENNPGLRRQGYNRRKRCSLKIQGSFWENCRGS